MKTTLHRVQHTGHVQEAPALQLRVIDDEAQGAAPGMHPRPVAGKALRLSCLLTLRCPGIQSSVERRRHLRDSLISGDASHNAAILARDPHFWDFLQQINLMAYAGEIDSRRARHFINRVCGVSGRYDFEHSDVAAQRYLTLIEQPFLHWLLAAECG